MRGKILLVVGLGVGYVLGARAGRERYEQIVSGAEKLWRDPRVQKQVSTAQTFAKEKGPEVAHAASEAAKTAGEKVSATAKKVQGKSSSSDTTSTPSI
ncbi:YtxH domain-containing protein [Desertivibrio insolitus]|uniref:YtxH domain-containing protein n=1 Tax=Herbiconiux sp. SYSU D00978 TaxID=2812562 RepID=UPI001A96E0C3|nr:YtxH domain-containing protein [Herbiconiux sp. SYSU D00978]